MSKYIGDVSAYAYAVSKGYTGTEEEFAELMADYADVGQRAEDAAESALNSKTAAQTAAQTATTKAGEASTSATSASGSASAASASASQASGSATSAANSATAASGSATSAAGSATTASTKASEASASATAAQTAQTAAEAAQTAAETAQGKAEDARDEAETTAQSISASAAQIATNTANITQLQSEVSQKANIDGAYSDLTAGNAEQLVSTVYEEDSVPYIFRTAGGSMDIGDREEDMLVGGTVAWNQLVQNGNFADGRTGWSFNNCTPSVSGNKVLITVTSGTKAVNFGLATAITITQLQAHKYLFGFNLKVSDVSPGTVKYNVTGSTYLSVSLASGVDTRIEGIFSSNGGENRFFVYPFGTSSVTLTGNETIEAHDYIMIDLTQMFGSTIADYVYSLETATPGAGVAWFKKLFPADYYPYDAGTLKSVEGVSSHDMVGFNQWDEEWEVGFYGVNGQPASSSSNIRSKNYIKVVPNTTYYAKGTPLYVCQYDADKNFIGTRNDVSNGNFTTLTNAHYIRFNMGNAYGTTYNHDICINLSWDGERNGEYEPYVKHSYPLDSSLTLRGIPKLDSANNLYYDGDTYESDGTVTRRYGVVDMGTLNWAYNSTYKSFTVTDMTTVFAKPSANDKLGNILCAFYVTDIANHIDGNSYNKTIALAASGNLFAMDNAYTDAAIFKSAMGGVYLVYELATPITETADPYQNPQIVDDFGTEEYVTTSIVPVGHVTKYQPNLRAKLEMSPDSPDGDGDYIVRQSNGENSYVSLASTATIQDILARLTALEGNTNEG